MNNTLIYIEILDARIVKLSEQLTNLRKTHQEQLKAINLLFDPQAENYKEIDFQGLYALLETRSR
jgi:hypothetical protein